MKKFSEWNKIDLHIHSKKSSLVKDNDYDGKEYTAEKLIEILTKEDNNISIFSITDHNCINVELYKNIETEIQKERYDNKINYIIGVELDVLDERIYSDVFHCLCFFGNKNIDIIEEAVNNLFNNVNYEERNQKNNFPNVTKIFDVFSQNKIEDIILIPHFNNKSKGLPQDIAIENLNYLCFNAYEDSNNINNIQKSLNIYLREGFDNFPFAVFSDNHNIDKYPVDKEGSKNNIGCYILGNLDEPFNSVKTAFQEARMRISLTSINNMRKINYPEKYLNKIIVNNISCDLSPYQNTIIGKFGSGKSLLLEKIKKGNESLKDSEKYNEFYESDKNFKIEFKNEKYNSLSELKNTIANYKVYEFVQQEKYYYKNYFSIDDAKQLFYQLNMQHDFVTERKFNFNTERLNNKFIELKNKIFKIDGKNNLNYGRAFDSQDYYSFSTAFGKINFCEIIEKLETTDFNLKTIVELSINGINIFDENDIEKITDLTRIINVKINVLSKLNDINYEKKIQDILKKYDDDFVNNSSKSIKDILLKDIKNFNNDLVTFSNECKYFDNVFTEEIYNDVISEKQEKIDENYKIIWKFNSSKDYKDSISSIVKDPNRKDTLFKSVIATLTEKENKFSNNKEFIELTKKYENYVNELFTSSNIRYDILFKDESMLKKSAGEKSSLFIKFIFDLLEKDLAEGNNVLLILDQPEDNIDNDNIYKEISNELRQLKIKYNNFQSIIITHNANVAICADSENIIVASEIMKEASKKEFKYESGCIENKKFIERVCDILEGGKKAMERRTTKYGINIIKKVEQNEI